MAEARRAREGSSLLRWRQVDTPHGVTHATAAAAADKLGLTETQLVHMAIAEYIARHVPQYDPDIGDISSEQLAAIRQRVQLAPAGESLGSLLD